MSTLGIDFGTSYSSSSFINADNKPQAVRFIGHNEKMPSIVSFYGGYVSIGYDADFLLTEAVHSLPPDEKGHLFAQTVKSIKRKLSENGTICNHSHRKIVSMILSHLKQESEKSCTPLTFKKLVLTHPVQFEEWKKNLLKGAALDAGFINVTLLPEPIAAAIGYCRQSGIEKTKGLLVFDFGAGTFDVAYVTRHNDRFIVPLPSKGDSLCGGDDIDDALYRYFANEVKSTIGNEYENRRDLGLLLQCRRWKEMLSTMESIPISIVSKTNPTKRFNSILTRNKFNEITSSIIDKTISLTKSVFDEIKENRLPLDYILLIGGSSNIPSIRQKLKSTMPDVEIRATGDADIAVALGASFYSQNPIEINPEKEWCYCMYCGKKILKSYNFCIYCGKANYLKSK